MTPARIDGCTRALGAPLGWDPATSGVCGVLPIRDDRIGDQPSMVSAWEPTPAEIAAIAKGAKIYLSVIGVVHPPVSLFVGAEPDE